MSRKGSEAGAGLRSIRFTERSTIFKSSAKSKHIFEGVTRIKACVGRKDLKGGLPSESFPRIKNRV